MIMQNKLTILIAALFLSGCQVKKLSTKPVSFYYQAYDAEWNEPSINPIFLNIEDAQDYAQRNNMGGGHGYIVRVVDWRYEVWHRNDAVNEVLHQTISLKDALNYLKEYEMAHSDLFVFDLTTGNVVEVSTP